MAAETIRITIEEVTNSGSEGEITRMIAFFEVESTKEDEHDLIERIGKVL